MDADAVTRLRRVIVRLARLFNRSSSQEDLSPTQASVLGLVASRGAIGLAELADIEGVNPTMLSRIVAKLDGIGLIHRVQDPQDLRVAKVEVTTEGLEVHKRVLAARTETMVMILQTLPPDTTDALLEALPALEALADGLFAKEDI